MLRIRSVTCADAAAFADIYRPVVEQTAVSFEYDSPGPGEMRDRIERVSGLYPWLVAEEDAVLGYASASKHRERAGSAASVDVSINVLEDVRGRGVGDALYLALFADFRKRESFRRAFAGITLPNEASVRLHVKHGFKLVGVYLEIGRKFGRWLRVAWSEREI
jgi:L-amino acid N-acyltransferase YncA